MKHLAEAVLITPPWQVALAIKTTKALCGKRVKTIKTTHQIENDVCLDCLLIAEKQNVNSMINEFEAKWFDNRD